MATSPMSETDLKALVDSEMRQAIGFYGGKLADQRRKAEIYYLGLPEGDLAPPEVEGRSKIISPDVRTTIEAMLPQLMVKFCGGDAAVEFEAQKPGDEEKAKQATDYLNYLFFKKCDGHNVMYTLLKDGLMLKRGFVKVWWDDRVEETKEEYRGLSDVELSDILDDKEVEAVSHSTYPSEEDAKMRQEAIEQLTQQLQQATQAAQMNPQAGQQVQAIQQQLQGIAQAPPVMLHDIEVKRSKKGGKIAVENVPPEEFLISRTAKNIETASFVGHRVARTRSDLKTMGYKNIDGLSGDDGSAQWNTERIQRETWDNEAASTNTSTTDKSQERIWITEGNIRCDYDGDGISELRKVVRGGNELLDNDVIDVVPFASVCPIPLPHKFFGLSIADLLMDGQLARTGLLRARFDNEFLQANGRYFAVDGQVNLDDLLTSRPGGIVRMKSAGMAGRLDAPVTGASTDKLLEYMEQFQQDASGYTRLTQGNSAGDLQGTATGMNIVTNKDDMRLDLIGRNCATGIADMFRLMLKLVCQHQHEAAEIKLNGEWLKIDPREWRNQFDVTINVGLGTGNKDQRIGHLMALRAQQDVSVQMGNGVATPENIYNANKELTKELGFKTPDKFFTDPVKNPPPPHPDPEQMKAQAQMPLIQAKGQIDAALKDKELAAEMQLERERMGMQAQVDQNRQASEEMQQNAKMEKEAQLAQYMAGLDAQKESAQMLHDNEQKAAEMAFQADQAERQRQHDLAIKQMDIEAADRKAQLAAAVSQHATETSAKTTMDTAKLSSDTTKQTAEMSAKSAMDTTKEGKAPPKPDTSLMDAVSKLAERVDGIHAHVTKPPEPRKPASLVRDNGGKAIAVKHGDEEIPIKRDAAGRVEGI